MIRLYEIFFFILFIIFFPFLFLFPRIRNTVFKRLFFGKKNQDGRESIWFHGASAGDILAIKPVIELFYKKYKERYDILITSNTESGKEIVAKYLPSDVLFSYLPFDVFISVNNFLRRYRPRILFVEASEFWPVLINRAYLFGTKIVLLNGNIKREKLIFYKILLLISSNPFKKYELMVVRNPESFDSAKYLGVEESRLIVCINTKYKSVFDMKERGVTEDIQKRFRDISKLVVFGSIHYEEEEEILYTVSELIKTDSDVTILLAPRHLERVEYLIKKLNTQIFKNQNIASRFTDGQTDTRVIVLNTIGDLFYIYPFAKAAFVGGSLTDRGGHNIFEPAVWGVPVITGKYVRNYEDIVRFLLGFGLITVNNGRELFEVVIEILNNEKKRENLSLMLKEKVALIQKDLVNIEDMFLSRFVL